jgi:hypothetical protein
MDTDTEANTSYQHMHAGTTNVTFHRLPYHSIQLVVRQVEKQPSFASLISKVLGIVNSVRVSSVAIQMMIQKCGRTLISGSGGSTLGPGGHRPPPQMLARPPPPNTWATKFFSRDRKSGNN